MTGSSEPIDEQYIRARRVLLDAIEALQDQRDAVILVGAQAIYLHVGDADLAVAPFTTDADLALDPEGLTPDPKLVDAMREAGFLPSNQVGTWTSEREGNVNVDLLVPEAVGGPGRRAARLGEHGNRVARKAHGLEGALVDKSRMTVEALEAGDERRFEVDVAGSAALLVAKLHKLGERQEDQGRLSDKDALDIYRLLRSIPTEDLADGLIVLCRDERSADVARAAVYLLHQLFSTADSFGPVLAARAAAPLEDPATIAQACAILAGDLLMAVQPRL